MARPCAADHAPRFLRLTYLLNNATDGHGHGGAECMSSSANPEVHDSLILTMLVPFYRLLVTSNFDQFLDIETSTWLNKFWTKISVEIEVVWKHYVSRPPMSLGADKK